MPTKPILFYSSKCSHSVKLIQEMKESGSLSQCICVNVSRPYQFKIPPNIRSVPSIMTTSGDVLTGMFLKQFITTVLPQLKSNLAGPRPQIPANDTTPTPPSVNSGSNSKRRVNFKESMDDPNQVAQQQLQNQQAGGLMSANFGTEFSGFSYLPGTNDAQETFQDFQYLPQSHTNSRTPPTNVSSKQQMLQKRLEAMKASRAQDLGR